MVYCRHERMMEFNSDLTNQFVNNGLAREVGYTIFVMMQKLCTVALNGQNWQHSTFRKDNLMHTL